MLYKSTLADLAGTAVGDKGGVNASAKFEVQLCSFECESVLAQTLFLTGFALNCRTSLHACRSFQAQRGHESRSAHTNPPMSYQEIALRGLHCRGAVPPGVSCGELASATLAPCPFPDMIPLAALSGDVVFLLRIWRNPSLLVRRSSAVAPRR